MSDPFFFQVSNELELNQAIATIEYTSGGLVGAYTIQFTANITEGTDTGNSISYRLNQPNPTLAAPPDLYAINLKGVGAFQSTLTIDGGGHTLSGAGNYRGFFAYSGAVTIENLNIDNTVAKGGNGRFGGGGGAGLGGGLFVGSGAQVTLSGVSFSNDQAQGGQGRGGSFGGGGGLGGNAPGTNGGSGGGIGSAASGVGSQSATPGLGIVLGAQQDVRIAYAAARYGGGGKDNGVSFNGGGIGGTAAPVPGYLVGGSGGFGGGGGSGRDLGGSGGFGGGGGAGKYGGNGGFGGGGGGGSTIAGKGGFGGGNGSLNGTGGAGGGLGAGGSIFVQQGGTLIMGAGTISGGGVQGGRSYFATNGSAFGSGIFVQGSDTLTFAPGANQKLTISDVIADQSGSGGTGENAGAAAVLVKGPGTVALGGQNTFTGGIKVEGAGAVLSISADNNLGAAGVTLGNGTGLEFTGSFTLFHTINVNGDPVFNVDQGQTVSVLAPITDGLGPGDVDKTGAGTLELDTVDSYSGGTTIEAGTLALGNAQGAGTGAITFAGTQATATLAFSAANAPTNLVDGFGTNDFIRIGNFIERSGTYFNGVLTLQGTDDNATPETVTLHMPGLSPSDFAVDVVAGTTTLGFGSNESGIVACYCRGTLIETARGQKKVETLNIGDEVVTASGALRPIKWIGRRSYGGRFIMGRKDILPICFKRGSLGNNVPERDLWISPHHAMYLSGVLIEAKDLINGVSIVQAEHVASVEYFHIELDTHDVIIAERALSETFIDDDSRGMFHNAHEYDMLYAEEHARPAHYCAPRLCDGYAVEAVRQRLALRAGLLRASDAPRAGTLRGYIDLIDETRIAGWAQNVDHPEAPVCLDIYAGGRLIGQTLANIYREDLQRAGIGSGKHSFEFKPPQGVALAGIAVRRSIDGTALLWAHAKRPLSAA